MACSDKQVELIAGRSHRVSAAEDRVSKFKDDDEDWFGSAFGIAHSMKASMGCEYKRRWGFIRHSSQFHTGGTGGGIAYNAEEYLRRSAAWPRGTTHQ
jgi:carbamoylphosphate synthase large subunit